MRILTHVGRRVCTFSRFRLRWLLYQLSIQVRMEYRKFRRACSVKTIKQRLMRTCFVSLNVFKCYVPIRAVMGAARRFKNGRRRCNFRLFPIPYLLNRLCARILTSGNTVAFVRPNNFSSFVGSRFAKMRMGWRVKVIPVWTAFSSIRMRNRRGVQVTRYISSIHRVFC